MTQNAEYERLWGPEPSRWAVLKARIWHRVVGWWRRSNDGSA